VARNRPDSIAFTKLHDRVPFVLHRSSRILLCFLSGMSSNLGRIAGARMRSRQYSSANFHIFLPACFRPMLQRNGHLHVAKLPKVIVMPLIVARPA
jgi:hypothetical protein